MITIVCFSTAFLAVPNSHTMRFLKRKLLLIAGARIGENVHCASRVIPRFLTGLVRRMTLLVSVSASAWRRR